MDAALLVGLIGTVATLAGVALTQWAAMRAARLQARQQLRLEVLRQRSQAKATATALVQQKREEFLGLVLTAQARILLHLDHLRNQSRQTPTQYVVPTPESAAFAARQAYAVALLYLADMRPLASAYFQATAGLELALETGQSSQATAGHVTRWREAQDALEMGITKNMP